jgi:hypothetical protein
MTHYRMYMYLARKCLSNARRDRQHGLMADARMWLGSAREYRRLAVTAHCRGM